MGSGSRKGSSIEPSDGREGEGYASAWVGEPRWKAGYFG